MTTEDEQIPDLDQTRLDRMTAMMYSGNHTKDANYGRLVDPLRDQALDPNPHNIFARDEHEALMDKIKSEEEEE